MIRLPDVVGPIGRHDATTALKGRYVYLRDATLLYEEIAKAFYPLAILHARTRFCAWVVAILSQYPPFDCERHCLYLLHRIAKLTYGEYMKKISGLAAGHRAALASLAHDSANAGRYVSIADLELSRLNALRAFLTMNAEVSALTMTDLDTAWDDHWVRIASLIETAKQHLTSMADAKKEAEALVERQKTASRNFYTTAIAVVALITATAFPLWDRVEKMMQRPAPVEAQKQQP